MPIINVTSVDTRPVDPERYKNLVDKNKRRRRALQDLNKAYVSQGRLYSQLLHGAEAKIALLQHQLKELREREK